MRDSCHADPQPPINRLRCSVGRTRYFLDTFIYYINYCKSYNCTLKNIADKGDDIYFMIRV